MIVEEYVTINNNEIILPNNSDADTNWFFADKHPNVDEWPLMKSPVPILIITAMYLMFVLKNGPEFMKNRKPYNLKWTLIIYNAVEVLVSLALCLYLPGFRIDHIIFALWNQGCYPKRTTESLLEINTAAWWYTIAKLFEYFDTIFFVLRKKQNQITKLHVYHHASTALISWAYLKYIPGEQGVILASLNSFVHIFMYLYYMIAAIGPEYQKYLWWKKYITILQIIQFVLDITYCMALLVFSCQPPKVLSIVFLTNTTLFFILFMKFYLRTYEKRKHSEKQL